MKKILLTFLFILILISCEKEDLEIIGTTENFSLTSTYVNDEYKIYVYLPPTYGKTSSNDQLIIGLDGDFNFNEIASIISEKTKNNTIEPSIYIGIGNSGARNRDYTPTAFKHGTGGAKKFYNFIIKELIPEIASRYNIDSNNTKTLMGHSFGGLFTQYAMFQERATNPFDKFIAVGVSYWYDSGIIFEYEQEYADINTDLPITFFNGMGTLEGGVSLASFEEMNERLKSRNYGNFKIKHEWLKKKGHSESDYIGYKKGLDYVFSN
ncbi:alpha/beta hydrolase [Aquimarina longa]|uniref:alpha/beta hydrolase n=1 Tax=Aquimarina longa TaxID=1080221 RepID=UPI000783D1C5|nr:alpha/beta hydrolase-fold protein [Aquimarina longa]